MLKLLGFSPYPCVFTACMCVCVCVSLVGGEAVDQETGGHESRNGEPQRRQENCQRTPEGDRDTHQQK